MARITRNQSYIDYKHLNELYDHIMDNLAGRPQQDLINLLQDYTDLMVHMECREETRKIAHEVTSKSKLPN